jgi:hypothetical protein
MEKISKSSIEHVCSCAGNAVGQNLYMVWSSSGQFPALNMTNAIQAWYAERQYWNYTTATCQPNQVCGHFTQVWTWLPPWWKISVFCVRMVKSYTLYYRMKSESVVAEHRIGYLIASISGTSHRQLQRAVFVFTIGLIRKSFYCICSEPEGLTSWVDLHHQREISCFAMSLN